MKVRVECLGQLGRIAGRTCDIELPSTGATLADLLAALGKRHGAEFSAIALDSSGAIRESLLVVVNGETVDKKPNRGLRDGDTVRLLAAIAGG